jgi:hypothetical protein
MPVITKQIDLRFSSEQKQLTFATAIQTYLNTEGHLPTDQAIIQMVIESARHRQERDESRANYNMLTQQYNDITQRYRQLLDRLQEMQERFANEARRA